MKHVLIAATALIFSIPLQAATLKCQVREELGSGYETTVDLTKWDGYSSVSLGRISGLDVDVLLSSHGERDPFEIFKICGHVVGAKDYQKVCSETKLNLVRIIQSEGHDQIESIDVSCELKK